MFLYHYGLVLCIIIWMWPHCCVCVCVCVCVGVYACGVRPLTCISTLSLPFNTFALSYPLPHPGPQPQPPTTVCYLLRNVLQLCAAVLLLTRNIDQHKCAVRQFIVGPSWYVWGSICYMASGFPSIAVTDNWLHSLPSPHILE